MFRFLLQEEEGVSCNFVRVHTLNTLLPLGMALGLTSFGPIIHWLDSILMISHSFKLYEKDSNVAEGCISGGGLGENCWRLVGVERCC